MEPLEYGEGDYDTGCGIRTGTGSKPNCSGRMSAHQANATDQVQVPHNRLPTSPPLHWDRWLELLKDTTKTTLPNSFVASLL